MAGPSAVIADQLGGPECYRLVPHDPGAPGPGHVRIAIKAAGVSFVDVLTAAGKYQVKPPLPFIPGSECAGLVEALGEGVIGLSVGQPVVGSNWGGLFADAALVPARSVRPAPAGLSLAQAALFPVSAYTARHALIERGHLQPGETLLVLGAGGATGLAAVQLGHHLGARVIASASSDAKRALALANGADAAIDARAENWRELVREANHGKAVDVVFDPVGGAVTEPAFRSLAWNGRHLVVGFTGGIASFRTNLALLKGASLIGVDLRQYGVNKPQAAEANARESFKLAEAGAIRPVIARSYRLEQFADAMADAEAGQSAGRIVLEMGS